MIGPAADQSRTITFRTTDLKLTGSPKAAWEVAQGTRGVLLATLDGRGSVSGAR